jgi:outer membrane lipoprotein-sorting protein
MNKTLRLLPGIIGLSICAVILMPSAVRAQSVEILNRIDKHYKAINSLTSNVKMDKFNSQLGAHDVSEGSLVVLPKTKKRKKMYARIDWTKPRVENLSIIGDEFMIYRPTLGVVYMGKTDKKQKDVPTGALDFLNMSRAQLKANYKIEVAGEEKIEGGIETKHLILTPLRQISYKKADIWIDKDGMIRLARTTEHNNDTTTVLLSNIKKNEKVKENAFTIKYPKSIKPSRI